MSLKLRLLESLIKLTKLKKKKLFSSFIIQKSLNALMKPRPFPLSYDYDILIEK